MTGVVGPISLPTYVPLAAAGGCLTWRELVARICSMARKRGRVRLSDQVREAVDASGLSRYRICKEADIAQAAMSRFMSGQGGLSMAALDRLGEVLSLNITTQTGRRRRAAAKPAKRRRN